MPGSTVAGEGSPTVWERLKRIFRRQADTGSRVPDFDTVLAAWIDFLSGRRLSLNLKWVFRENVCLLGDKRSISGIAFETSIRPVTVSDVKRVYEATRQVEGPLVFETLVQAPEFTLCDMLGDTFTTADDHYISDWNIYFYAKEHWGDGQCVCQEISDPAKWRSLKARECKCLSELDYLFPS